MKYPTIFHLISSVCAEKDAGCVLIGGFAVNHYGVSRSTADADFLATKDDYDKILPLLEQAGFRQDYTYKDVFARLTANKDYLLDLDFMFVDIDTLNKIIKEAEKVTIAEQKFIVPSLNHLIALKLHAIKYNPGREYKDLMDIIELIKVNRANIKTDEFKQLCFKYGTEGLYNKILDRA